MASGKITNKNTLSGAISSGNSLKTATVTGGSGTTDHSRLINRAEEDQHPIESITGLRSELDSKLNSKTALPLIEEALQGKARGLYFDALKELARKPYWYLTAEIDPKTGLGSKDSIISGPYDLGMGGGSGGGGGGVTTVSVKPINWPVAAPVGNSDVSTKITVNWSSVIGEDKTPTGEGTLYLSINGKQVETRPKQSQGNIDFDISKYIISGDNTIQVKVLDMYGTTGITVGTITGVSLELKSTFNQEQAFYGKVDFTYTPIGSVTKKVYFIIDGDKENAACDIVKSSNELQTHSFYGLSHGAHTLQVYFEADVGGQIISSNTLFYDITFVEEGNSTPIIASEFNKFTQDQYISFSIPYRVFIDGRSMATVSFKVNGQTIRTVEVTTNGTHIWAYRYDEYTAKLENGNIVNITDPLTLEIICGSVVKRFEVTVVESQITVTPVLNNLELALSANGKSNDDLENRENWSYTTTPPSGSNEQAKTYACTFTNFNWKSDGWVIDKLDELGNPTDDSTTVLRVGGAARVEIPLEVFANNFTAQGKTIEFEIATHGIRNYESTIISCLDKEETPFYAVEPLYVQEEERLNAYEISYTYSLLSEAITKPDKYLFTFNNGVWTLDTKNEAGETVTKTINLSDYGITLTETLLNAEGEDLGTVINGDRILVNFSMEARGFEVTPQVASIRSQQSFLSTQYKEDEHVRISFVVEPTDNDHNRIIWMYINGVASGAMQYPDGEVFQQKAPNYITIGSSEAIVDIYNIRIYSAALTNRQLVNNWIADTADASLKASRFNHNQVLNEQDQVTPASLLIGAPDLPYIIWDIDELPTTKDARVGNAYYTDPTDSTRNFTAIDAEYKVQGTSSAVYPTKNIRLRTKKGKGGPNLEWYDDDGNDLLIKNGGKGFPITYPEGMGVDYFTFKVDYASSEGANNVELVRLYNDASKAYGLLTPPQRQNDQVRVGIDGFPVVAFHQDANDNISFYTKANFNNDKNNPDVYGFDGEWQDENTKDLWLGDESWETTNNSAAETKYQKPVTVENFEKGFEIRFPDEDGYNKMDKLGPMTAWVHSTYRDAATGEPLNPPVVLPWQSAVQAEDGSISTKTEPVEFTHDTADYRLAKFKAELKDWFNVDSCLFYYLFTELFLMIDSRAKNAFPTYFVTREKEPLTDEEGNVILNSVRDANNKPRPNSYSYADGGNRWYWIPYDMDTAIGIDNKGKLTFDYWLEDKDKLDGADVYNGQTSVMWCNIRDAFKAELAAMYSELRVKGLISYDEVERRFEEHQGKWPEVILNLDAHNKYVLPLKKDNYLEMLQGTKAQQRKWWLYNRFKYMDSKYNAGDAKSDFVQFRAYVDIGQEKPDITVVPYANIYATASFGNGSQHTVSERVIERGLPVTLKNTFGVEDDENDQETYIYSASQLKSIGDISPFHPDTVKIGNAIRLQELKVGDNGDKYPGYKNPYLKELTVGANTLLRTLDARNCINLGTGVTTVPDLSKCTNIEEIYFTGTKIQGITLPDGGTIKKLYLPGTLKALTIQNQPLLEDLKIENTNTTITKSVNKEDGYSFIGLVVKKEDWNTTSANANLYLADSLAQDAPRVRVNIAKKNLYESITETKSILAIECPVIDARFDLIEDETTGEMIVQLAEYSTRNVSASIPKDNPDTNISTLITTVAKSIQPPALEEFTESLIERLWLEGIPSKAIKAKEFIKNMKPGTRVRLININETYSSLEEINEFYDLLDRHYGINFNNSPTEPKAQVTGVINIDTISYRDYAILTARYPEVTINAKQIISTVTFYNDGKAYSTTNIALSTALDSANKLIIYGKPIKSPADPTKEPTQAYYYTFTHWNAKKATYAANGDCEYETSGETWSPEYLVVADTRVDAVYAEDLQEYRVIFDTDSDLISVDDAHKDLVVKYGSTITQPELLNIPEGVTLVGWVDETDAQWVFETSAIKRDTVLKAQWIDETIPYNVFVNRCSYNTFSYEASDNLGIIAWAVVKNSETEPAEWTTIKSTTHLTGIYEISSEGEYHFWITDANGNKATKKINAYKINTVTTPGITEDTYYFTEGNNTFITTFALSGTTLGLVVGADEHYENISIKINPNLEASIDRFTVSEDILIQLSCIPKDYIITFNLGGKGDVTKAPDQLITYLHLAKKPQAQYNQPTGEVIDSWYTDPDFTNQWDFETSVVNYHTTLYAKWEVYHSPTVLTVQIPEGDEADRTILVAYTQQYVDNEHKVVIEWGDGATYSSTETKQALHPSHTYAAGGVYTIKIHGPGGNTEARYQLGDGYAYALVTPSKYLIDIDFAWDISQLAAYALRESSLTYPRISEYMSTISVGCYDCCKNLQQINIPENIRIIGDQAFSACSNASGLVKIPRLIEKIGHTAFQGCSKITRFELLCDTTPELYGGDYGGICRNCFSLKEIAISDHITIPEQMFMSSGLEEIKINNKLGAQAFAYCSSLKKVISNSDYFGQQAFLGCTSLETVVLTNPNLKLESYVFQNCPKLETFGPITAPVDDKYTYDFNYAWDTELPAYAFQRDWDSRHNVKSVVLPVTLKKIGTLAFHNAVDLREITLPAGLEELGEQIFEACSSLKKVVIPASVENIKAKIFAGCTGLTEVNIKALSSNTKIDDPKNSWFYDTNTTMKLYVPDIIFTSTESVADRYGLHWNACREVNGVWDYIGYNGYTEPNT